MASRCFHLAIASRIAELYPLEHRERFLLGSLAPDAVSDAAGHYASHYRYQSEDGKRGIDLDRFIKQWSALLDDEFLLGYYGHLISDLLYRCWLYETIGYQPDEANRQKLYADYHGLNAALIRCYGLKCPAWQEPPKTLKEAFDLDLPALLEQTKNDFNDIPILCYHFIDETAAQDLIERCAQACVKAFEKVENKECDAKLQALRW